jgi:hypothetical protein
MKFFLPALALFITGLVTDHAFAEVTALGVAQGIGTFAGLIDVVTGTVVKAAGTFLMAAAMVVFFYGLVEFIIASRKGDGPGITNGKVFMVWSLAALFVMFSVYGIIKFGQGIIFQGNDVNTITIPELNFIKGVGSQRNTTPAVNGVNTQSNRTPGFSNPSLFDPSKLYQNNQNSALSAYNDCIGGSGKTEAQCQAIYKAYDGAGTGKQNLADQAYNECIANGNTASDCQKAYQAYGGTGSGTENLANKAYSECISNGGSSSQCQTAYNAYGGTVYCEYPQVKNEDTGECYTPQSAFGEEGE